MDCLSPNDSSCGDVPREHVIHHCILDAKRIDCGIAPETTWGHTVGDTMHRRCRCSNNFTNCIVYVFWRTPGVKPCDTMLVTKSLSISNQGTCGDSPGAEVSFRARKSHGHWRVAASAQIWCQQLHDFGMVMDGYGPKLGNSYGNSAGQQPMSTFEPDGPIQSCIQKSSGEWGKATRHLDWDMLLEEVDFQTTRNSLAHLLYV